MEGSIMQRVVRRMVAFRWHRLGFALLLVGLLVLPAPLTATPCTYTVQRGDTLWQIAARHGTSVQAILQANPQIINPDLIRVGQQLGLPSCSGPTLTPATPTPAPPPPSGSDFPTRPEHPVPPLPQELPAPLWQRAHDATIEIRHPIEEPNFWGSGVVVGRDGRTFITAYHVIGDALNGQEADRIAVGPFGDWHFTADVIATDPSIDLAVLRVREPDFPGFAAVPLAAPDKLEPGDPLYTLSYPGKEGWLASDKGRYLAQAHTFHNRVALIVTNAGATYGSSGGPAVNEHGELIGVIVGGVLGHENMKALGYPNLDRATLIVPIDAAADLLAKAGVNQPEPPAHPVSLILGGIRRSQAPLHPARRAANGTS